MPYVNVKVTREGVTADDKAAIISGMTQVLVDVLHKDPALTFVVIDEVDLEAWGVGGLPTPAYRAQRSA
jgi:4-oxalocrotonate tautomerase